MDGLTFSENSTRQAFRIYRDRPCFQGGDFLRTFIVMCNESKKFTINLTHVTLGRTRELHRIRDERIEYWLQLRG